jgi:hypothetical protein
MTCPRVWEVPEIVEIFLETVKRALEERVTDAEYCVYDRDMFDHFMRRPNPGVKVYACGAYSEWRRRYRLFVAPGAVIMQIIIPAKDITKFRCRVITDYDTVERHVKRRRHYEICIFRRPVELPNAAGMCTG